MQVPMAHQEMFVMVKISSDTICLAKIHEHLFFSVTKVTLK